MRIIFLIYNEMIHRTYRTVLQKKNIYGPWPQDPNITGRSLWIDDRPGSDGLIESHIHLASLTLLVISPSKTPLNSIETAVNPVKTSLDSMKTPFSCDHPPPSLHAPPHETHAW